MKFKIKKTVFFWLEYFTSKVKDSSIHKAGCHHHDLLTLDDLPACLKFLLSNFNNLWCHLGNNEVSHFQKPSLENKKKSHITCTWTYSWIVNDMNYFCKHLSGDKIICLIVKIILKQVINNFWFRIDPLICSKTKKIRPPQ